MSIHPNTVNEANVFQHLDVEWDKDESTLWCYMTPHPRPCFNPQLLSELNGLKDKLHLLGINEAELNERPSFAVFASGLPGVFNLGGDLGLFRQFIDVGDRRGLETYARACIDAVHKVSTGFDLPLTNATCAASKSFLGTRWF